MSDSFPAVKNAAIHKKNGCLIVTVCFEEPVIMATGLQVAARTKQMFVSVFSISSDLSPAKTVGRILLITAA